MKVRTGRRLPVRAEFDLHVCEEDRQIRIMDQNRDSMSVTNDMERVLTEVAFHIDRTLADYEILYRDSEGDWDRVVMTALDDGTFEAEIKVGPRGRAATEELMSDLRRSMT